MTGVSGNGAASSQGTASTPAATPTQPKKARRHSGRSASFLRPSLRTIARGGQQRAAIPMQVQDLSGGGGQRVAPQDLERAGLFPDMLNRPAAAGEEMVLLDRPQHAAADGVLVDRPHLWAHQ